MTLKQRKALKLVEKCRSMKEVMEGAGYSSATATHPTKLTKSKGWQALLEKHLPDDNLLTATKEALIADKVVTSLTEPDRTLPDHAIRLKAAEQGYKLKGRYSDVTINQQFNAGEMKIEFE